MNSLIRAPLPAPAMQNLHDPSGIGYADTLDPSVPLSVRVGPYTLMTVGDIIELFCDDVRIVNYTIKEEDLTPETPSFIVLPLDQHYIHPEQITLFYKVTEPIGGGQNQSLPATIRVKLTLPGGTDTNPSTPWENEALAKAIVIPPGIISSPEGVSVTIDPYKNMEVGDKITLSWNGEFVRYELNEQGEVGQPLVLSVPKEIIDAAGDSDMLEVRYEIRDVVNNWSRWSLPTYVEVEAGNSTLPAPVAPQAANMELNLETLAGADVQALVLAYPGIDSTDQITFTVERNTAEGMGLEPYVAVKPVGSSIGFVEFLIPNEQFEPIAQGRARLKYRVKKIAGEEQRSKSLSLTVVGEIQALAPPKLPIAEQNNGVLDPTSTKVIAQVPPYYFMADGNDVALVWMGKTAGGANVVHEEIKNLNSDDVGKTLEFLIPDDKVSALAGGSLELYYTVTTFARAFFKSPSLHVPVSADGGHLLPVPAVDQVNGEGVLDPADIVLEAVVRIRPYAGMAPLDKVTLHWEGQAPDGTYSAHTTLNTGNINKEVIFRVKKQYVDANLNGNVEVWYQVERGNRTLTSEKLPLKIGQSVVSPLPDPVVKEAKPDNTLDPVDTTNGATLAINASANLKAGDVVTCFWKGAGGSDTKEKIISADLAGKALEVIFSSALVTANLGYTVEIAYHVKHTNGTDQPSPVLNLLITAGLSNLEKPLVAGVVDNLLAPESVPDYGVTVTVPRYVGIAAGDSIVVKWAGAAAHATEPQTVETPGPLDFTVPKSVAVASANSAVSVTYEVTRGALTVASHANQFSVGAVGPALTIDRSELVLSARIFRHDKVPSNPPAGAFAERVASGGQPPYTYSVDHPVVNIDEASGRVVSLKSGSGVVTATDSAGSAVSYPINVSGVVRLFSAGGYNTFTQSNRAVANEGGAIPSLDAWKELRRNYGDASHMEDGFCWASDAAGKHKRWAINANSGAAQPLRDFGFGGDSARGYGYKAD